MNDDHDDYIDNSGDVFLMRKKIDADKLVSTWLELQENINCLYDSSRGTGDISELAPGIRQALEKKEGLFRRNMMGKRVNYAARSVISPDPYLHCNQIGVPKVFD